jgi:hypothetical protein
MQKSSSSPLNRGIGALFWPSSHSSYLSLTAIDFLFYLSSFAYCLLSSLAVLSLFFLLSLHFSSSLNFSLLLFSFLLSLLFHFFIFFSLSLLLSLLLFSLLLFFSFHFLFSFSLFFFCGDSTTSSSSTNDISALPLQFSTKTKKT